MRGGVRPATTLRSSCRSGSKSRSPGAAARMGLITGLCAFLYHLPQIYKWLLKPYYLVSFFMTVAFLVVRKAPGVCEHLATDREDGNSCDFDWVRAPGDHRRLPADHQPPPSLRCLPALICLFLFFISNREK